MNLHTAVSDEVIDSHCTICQGRNTDVVYRNVRDHLLPPTQERWEIRRCLDCGFKFTYPPVPGDKIGPYYQSSYMPYHVTGASSNAGFRLFRFLLSLPYRIRFGAPARQPAPFGAGRALDIGCGSGAHLKDLAGRGWTIYGLDLSPDAVAAARRNNPGAEIHLGPLESFRPDVKFDFITMRHVLEHVPDPVDTLRRCSDILAPGGQLMIEVPNVESPEAKLFGAHWLPLDTPRHYNHFGPKTLSGALAKAGLVVERQRTAFFASSLSESFLTYISQWAGNGVFYNRVGRFIYYASYLPASVSYLLGNNPVIQVFAKHRD